MIAAAALDILDESPDPSGLTVRVLAQRLGVQAPSLYAHVSGIDEVIDLVHQRINETIDTSVIADAEDLEALRAFGRLYYRAYRQHPAAAALITNRGTNQEHALDIYEAIAAFLLRAGAQPEDVLPIMAMLDAVILGSAVEPFAAGFPGPARGYQHQHPSLAVTLRAIRRQTIDTTGFEWGLSAVIDAISLRTAPR
ncbi:MAG: hypothetical protein K9G24_04665 [Candidatus Nanopelagicales bacterium]|nr:hypothetical protein [Candidatus Nanopelagicales bacterium]MCF8536879.1 hypothetical protein [Candidatus Nanopelagicales bacterium]MCF8542357.1 hypothetical protein [Candidatus Nanopelagicales bacterium]MCF8557648.1 hypothetical protein [Candidatus Nanopelagicales bacterium]